MILRPLTLGFIAYITCLLAGCAIVFIAIMVFATHARAHELWQNGDPIPAWVKSSCCGPTDAHNLPNSDVFVSRRGYLVAGRAEPIPFEKTLPSPDNTYWIFYTGDINTATIYCMFVPHNGV